MAKKRTASSARDKQRAWNGKYMPDSQLDLSDIPEMTGEELRRARRVGRPVTGNAKRLIAIRISPRVLANLRRLAAKQSKPYQTYIHEILERAASKATGKKVA
jgi:predicted DNA binding CopG/RHH family protein